MCLNSVATTTTGESSTAVPVSVMVSSYLTMSRPEKKDIIYQREGGKGERQRQTSIDFRFFPRDKNYIRVGTVSSEFSRNAGSCKEV